MQVMVLEHVWVGTQCSHLKKKRIYKGTDTEHPKENIYNVELPDARLIKIISDGSERFD